MNDDEIFNLYNLETTVSRNLFYLTILKTITNFFLNINLDTLDIS